MVLFPLLSQVPLEMALSITCGQIPSLSEFSSQQEVMFMVIMPVMQVDSLGGIRGVKQGESNFEIEQGGKLICDAGAL